MQHLVCGDHAATQLRLALGAHAQILVLRDDLAIGPLQDIDQAPCSARVSFWQQLWDKQAPLQPDFGQAMLQELRTLEHLSGTLTLWHGDSCTEQLSLARVAYQQRNNPQPLWEVPCGVLPQQPRRTVSLCSPATLRELAQYRRQLSTTRRQQLAQCWLQQCRANAELRLWQAGQLVGQHYAEIDQALLAACQQSTDLAHAMAQVMRHSVGFYPTDSFLLWRARLLHNQGLIELRGPPGDYGYRGLRLVH